MYINDKNLCITPVIELQFAYLVNQDTKFDPKWCVNVVLDPTNKAHQPYIDAMLKASDDVADELRPKLPQKDRNRYTTKEFFKAEEDSEGNVTGRLYFQATSKNKPKLVDSQGKNLSDDIGRKVGNGTQARVRLSLKKSTVSQRKTLGITPYLNAVQVIDLVEYDGDGFDAVDGGYQAPAEEDFGGDF